MNGSSFGTIISNGYGTYYAAGAFTMSGNITPPPHTHSVADLVADTATQSWAADKANEILYDWEMGGRSIDQLRALIVKALEDQE